MRTKIHFYPYHSERNNINNVQWSADELNTSEKVERESKDETTGFVDRKWFEYSLSGR